MEKRFLSVPELADLLGISRSTIYHRCARGAENPFPIPSKRIGRLVRFDRRDVEEFMGE
ncbi:helix-turn-helix transcriptional regulator [Pseudodesulfovibrio indicus]|uniref:helix-turn-helix transcriptional regulator n=1 Tax=Pseudodesulfovibrio indicus TaxID=1716143 RepID=UPI001416F3A4|nr:helix-turn-helix domain-containing protein [Pseudodesulfovibrio indicus]